MRKVKEILENIITESKTIEKFYNVWKNNFLRNKIHYKSKKYDFSDLEINKKKCILVCGGGPGLQEKFDEIKKIRDSIYIASSDTALKILIKNGITPDSVFSFDPQHFSYYHFTGFIPNNIRVFTDFISGVRLKKQTVIFSNHPFKDEFFDNAKKKISIP
ncbi:MAG: 6-hydroxymethylpterin diphosphokinase MptE-like protein, partial [Bacteroidales bacterium]